MMDNPWGKKPRKPKPEADDDPDDRPYPPAKTVDYSQCESWRDVAALAHHRIQTERNCGTMGIGPSGAASHSYGPAVRRGYTGHMGEWINTVENAGMESADSKVPNKILKKARRNG